MKKLRKIAILLLAVLMSVFMLTGCSGGDLTAYTVEESSYISGDSSYVWIDEDDEESQTDRDDAEVESESQTEQNNAMAQAEDMGDQDSADETILDPDGSYTTKEDVALYIHTYGELPGNFITKKEAKKLGWSGGSLEPYAPGKSIGGEHFGNYEGVLPEDGNYTECDIDTMGADKRGAKRIVFDDEGNIYYTEDHYEHFEQLY